MDARDHGVAVLQLGALGGHQAEDDLLARRHVRERLEAAGALVVELQVEGVDVLAREQDGGHQVVRATRGVGGVIVAAAHVRGDGHVGGASLEREVVHAQVLLGLGLGRGAGGADARLEALVYERAPGAVIELQVAAARGVKFGDHGAVRGADILEQLVLVRVEAVRALGRRLVTVKLEQELGGGGDGLLSRVPRLLERLNELEVLDEGVVLTGDLAGEDG